MLRSLLYPVVFAFHPLEGSLKLCMRRTARAAGGLVSNHEEDDPHVVLDALVVDGEASELGDPAETNGQRVATGAPAYADANPRTESLLSTALSKFSNDSALSSRDLEDDGMSPFGGEFCADSNHCGVVTAKPLSGMSFLPRTLLTLFHRNWLAFRFRLISAIYSYFITLERHAELLTHASSHDCFTRDPRSKQYI